MSTQVRFSDFANVPEFVLRNFLATSGATLISHPHHLEISAMPTTPPLDVIASVDSATMSNFATYWEIAEPTTDTTMGAAYDPIAIANSRSALEQKLYPAFTAPLLLEQSLEGRFRRLRDVMLPAFFDVFPGGKVLLLKFDQRLNATLAALSLLKRIQILQTYNQNVLASFGSASALSSYGLSTVAGMAMAFIGVGLSLFYPKLYGIVSMDTSRSHIIVFLFDQLVELPDDVEHDEILRSFPWLKNTLSATPPTAIALPPFHSVGRAHLLDRRHHNVHDLEALLRAYVAGLSKALAWLIDLTAYHGQPPRHVDFDIDYAIDCHMTFFELLIPLVQIVIAREPALRKMALFDFVDMLASFRTTHQQRQPVEWKTLLRRAFSDTTLATALSSYPAPYGTDFSNALTDIRARNDAVVSNGVLYNRIVGNNVTTARATYSISDFEVELLRQMRNLKHGFSLSTRDCIDLHTGEFDNEFPDIAILLLLGFFADPMSYARARQ